MYKIFFYGDYAIVFSSEMKITLLPKRLSYLGYVLNGGDNAYSIVYDGIW